MAKPTFRNRDCRDLLAFEEVSQRLGLGTRLPAGRREVAVADIIGSVGRVADFDGCFRPRHRRLRDEIRARVANPAVVDMPISLLQVDHAFFVEDGHKRLSAAIAEGRREVDANVDRFQTRFHVAPGTTMASIRVTASERRFRNVTGLEAAVPRRRFPLSEPDGYLELQESVKAHTLDFSRAEGRLVPPEEGALHWYETVFVPILELIESTGMCRLLESMTEADRFLLFRRGIDVPMLPGWRIPPVAAEHGMKNITEGTQVGWQRRLVPLPGRQKTRQAPLLPVETEADDGRSPGS
jgi:hypothetical protein